MAINTRRNRQGKVTGYQPVVAVPNPRTGKKERRALGVFLRRRDAEAAERRALVDIQNGVFELEPPAPPKIVTVADACTIWLDIKRRKLRSNTINGYEIALRNHLFPEIGDRDVTTLTHDDVQAMVNRWAAEGKGVQTVSRAVMILRSALDRQVGAGVLPANPAAGVETVSPKGRKELATWSEEETVRFLDVAEQDRLAPFWYLTLLEGMRRGEALGLRWSDLHWSDDGTACVATISRTVVPDLERGGATLVQEGLAKTRASRRSVLLTRETMRVLTAHRDRQRFERQALGEDDWRAGDAILTTSVGTIPNPTTVKTRLRNLIAQAGVTEVTTHDLRHMAATRMLRAGVSPALVAQKLGHSDISTTTGTYGHLIAEDQSAANRATEEAIARGRAAG